MARYHISSSGTPAVCHAEKGNCPLGGADGMQNHFDTKEAAQAAADRQALSGFEGDRLSQDKHEDMSNEYLNVYKNAKLSSPFDTPYDAFFDEKEFRTLTDDDIRELTGREPTDRDRVLSHGHLGQHPVELTGELTTEQQEFVNSVFRGHKHTQYNPDGYKEFEDRAIRLQTDQPSVLFDKNMNDDSVVLDANPVRRGLWGRGEGLKKLRTYKATMSPDEYVNAVGTIYNVAHSRNNKDMAYNEALTTIQAGSVTRGDIKLKMSAQNAEDIKADCGTFAAARKYASEVEGLSNDEINDIVDNEGLVSHFRKESGLSKRETSNIAKTNLSLLKEKTGFNPDDYDKRIGYVATEYAMKKPMKDWNANELKQAIADSPKDIKQHYPKDNVSRYDTMRTQLGLHPHAVVDTGAMNEDQITKYKLWDANDRMILDGADTGYYNGKLHYREDENGQKLLSTKDNTYNYGLREKPTKHKAN